MKPTIIVIAFAALCVAGYTLLDDVQPREVARSEPRASPLPARTTTPAWTPPERSERRPDIAVEHQPAVAAASDEALSAGEIQDKLQTAFGRAALGDVHDSTRGLEVAIRAALPASSKLRSVECRGSLCRVETTHPDADEFRAFVQATFQPSSSIPSGPAFVSLVGEPVAGQPMTAVAFLSQPGTELPVRETTASLER